MGNTQKVEGCVFCRAVVQQTDRENLVLYRGEYSYVILNLFPYASGHLMVVPYDHRASLEDLFPECRAEMMELTSASMQVLRQVYHPTGFNLGANIGTAAGAGIASHVHLHVVPRWAGDTNFMTTVADSRVLPEALEDTYDRILQQWLINASES